MRFDTIQTVLRRAVVVGGIVGVAIGVVVGLVGLAIDGIGGLASGLVGSVLTIVFLGVTAVGVLVSGRFTRGDSLAPMAILMGGWFLKLALFLVVMIALRAQPWVQPQVLFASIVLTVAASLIVDAVMVAKARIPVTDRA